mgnify:CR=1 FL=1
MGLTNIQKAKNLLNKYAPKGEELAYINSKEAKLLKSMGGAGIDINGTGIKSYVDFGAGPGSVSESLGGGSSSSSGSSSSNDDNDDYMNYYVSPAPAPAPAPEPETTRDVKEAEFATGSYTAPEEEDDTSGEDFEEDVFNVMEELGIKDTFNAPTGFTSTTGEDGLGEGDYDDGKSLYTSNTQTTKEEEPYYGYTPGLNTVTAGELSRFNRGIGDIDELGSTFSKIQAANPIEEKGFFDNGISGVLKGIGSIALPFVAAPIAGLVGGKTAFDAVNLYNRANYISKQATKYGLTDKTLAQTLLDPNKGTGPKGPPTGFDDDNDSGSDGNTLVANNVIAKNVQKYSAAQINNVKSTIDLFEDVISKGEYQGRQLNRSQIAQVASKRSELMQEYDMIMESLV